MTMVEPKWRVSGSTWVWCWLVGLTKVSVPIWVRGTLASAGEATSASAVTTAKKAAASRAGKDRREDKPGNKRSTSRCRKDSPKLGADPEVLQTQLAGSGYVPAPIPDWGLSPREGSLAVCPGWVNSLLELQLCPAGGVRPRIRSRHSSRRTGGAGGCPNGGIDVRSSHDVVIIGAGLAGLHAALVLQEAGLD